MKRMVKVLSLTLICVMVFSMSMMVVLGAEYVPSKSTGDMVKVEITSPNLPPDAKIEVHTVPEAMKPEEKKKYEEELKICEEQVQTLVQMVEEKEEGAIEEYFGELKDQEGNEVKLTELLQIDEKKAETLKVYELCPLVVDGYKEEYGALDMKLSFATEYKRNEKVIILVGIVKINPDGTQTVEWVPFEGIGTRDGGIEVQFTPEIMKAAQEGTAIMAVVSKDDKKK